MSAMAPSSARLDRLTITLGCAVMAAPLAVLAGVNSPSAGVGQYDTTRLFTARGSQAHRAVWARLAAERIIGDFGA